MKVFGLAIKMKEQKSDFQKSINTIQIKTFVRVTNLEDTEVFTRFLTIYKPEIHSIEILLPNFLSADRLSKHLNSLKNLNKKV